MDISVVIPVYNMEKYITDCLESAIYQTTSFADIIVVDDGSTDSSFSVCTAYAEKAASISVWRQENQKQGAARNNGLKKVKSSYVMFLDSDDMLRRDTVEILLKVLEERPVDVLYFDTEVINELAGYQVNHNYHRESVVSYEIKSGMEYFEKYYPEGYVVSPCMAVYRTEFLQKYNICFPEGGFYEDNFFTLKCMLQAEKVCYLSERLYIRRYRAASVMTGNMTFEKYQNMRDVFYLCWEYLANKKDYTGEKKILYLANTYMELKWALAACDLSGISPSDELPEVVHHFGKAYKELDAIEKFSFSTAKRLLFFMEDLDALWETELFPLVFSSEKTSLVETCKRSYLPYIKQQVERLSFDKPDQKVGIYGMGAHTKRLLKWYTHFKGAIRCRLYFVDTYKESFQEEYLGYEVINVKDAKAYVDTIVISSDRYEKQMEACIRKLFGDSMRMITFYDKEKESIFISFHCIKGGIVSKLLADRQ